MIIEYIRYGIPTEQAAEFEQAYAAAATALDASPHCLGYDLAVCSEDPTQYVLRIEWDSADGHMQGFRRSPQFRQFLPHIQPYIKAIVEMRHYTPTAVVSHNTKGRTAAATTAGAGSAPPQP